MTNDTLVTEIIETKTTNRGGSNSYVLQKN